MDLDEHALSEGQRTLKRLGVTHVWPSKAATSSTAPEPADVDTQPLQTDKQLSGFRTLPPILQGVFHGKQSRARTLWTYAGMHQDLLQADIPERLAFFQKIRESVCTHLAWRHEDIAPWPLDLDPHLWAEGLAQLRPDIIICFGDASRLTSGMAMTIPVHNLPDLIEMARGNRDLKNEAWRILRTLS